MFNIITRNTLLAYCSQYPKARNALLDWYHEMRLTEYQNFQDLKLRFPNASLVGDDRVVFNIMGNNFRLVVRIVFSFKTIQIKWFGTHKEYDRIDVETVKFKKK